MNFSVLAFLVCVCFLTSSYAFFDNNFSRIKRRVLTSTSEDAGKALLLTPLIDAGKLKEARNRARVQPPLLGKIESYSGYFTVNRTTLSHLFFWYIPKTKVDYTSAPLILWLNGGPGCSSLFGLFNENGPFKVNKKGKLQKRVHAWTDHYNLLYIDQPVGTGFSFTEYERGYVFSEEKLADHLYEALLQFYKVFPELNHHDFFIAGESYGGKYVPAIGYKIHTVQRRSNSTSKIPLKGMMIGNGYSDPENMLGYAAYLHSLGLIDEHVRARMEDKQERIKSLIRSSQWELANKVGDELFDDMGNALNSTSLFDYTRDDSEDLGDSYAEFLTQDRIRRAIHVGRVPYQMVSRRVAQQFKWDVMKTVRPWIEELLEHYPMLFYNGQMDIVVAYFLTENFLRNLHWSGADRYSRAERQIWRVGDSVAGYYKSAANLVEVLVRNAGHEVPFYQPKNALNLIDLFIEKKLQDNSTSYE